MKSGVAGDGSARAPSQSVRSRASSLFAPTALLPCSKHATTQHQSTYPSLVPLFLPLSARAQPSVPPPESETEEVVVSLSLSLSALQSERRQLHKPQRFSHALTLTALARPLSMGAAPAPPPSPPPPPSSSSASATAAATAAHRGLSKGKRTFAGVLALTAAIVAGIHLNQRWEREVRRKVPSVRPVRARTRQRSRRSPPDAPPKPKTTTNRA